MCTGYLHTACSLGVLRISSWGFLLAVNEARTKNGMLHTLLGDRHEITLAISTKVVKIYTFSVL